MAMETILLGAFEVIQQSLLKVLLKEDTGAIKSGGGHQAIQAKSKLQEIEKYISYASYILARGFKDSSVLQWMTAAQLDAFCLEDQIAMYANRDFDDSEFYIMKKVIGMSSLDELNKKIQKHIKEMPMDLQMMAKISENSPFARYSHPGKTLKILGMDGEKNKILKILGMDDEKGKRKDDEKRERMDDEKRKTENDSKTENKRKVLFIVGVEGSGKTFLIDKMCEEYLKKKVKDQKIKLISRVNVSETRGLVDLLKAVLEGSAADIEPDDTDEFKILKKIQETFKDKNYLIVLDDVQDISILYCLMHILKETDGNIVVLTRRTDIENSLDKEYMYSIDWQYDMVSISPLGREISLRLLKDAASSRFDGTESDHMDQLLSLPDTEWDVILDKCQDNPWNIWTVGKLLAEFNFDHWRGIKERIDAILISHDDKTCQGIKCDPPVKLEEAKLEDAKSPGDVRHCFLYCLAFPDNSEIQETAGIPKRKLIRLWMAEGFMQDSPHQTQEQAAEDLLEELVKRKLLVVAERSSIDGEVLKFRVNNNIRSLALDMCESQKFCRFLPPRSEASSASQASSSLNIPLPRKKKALSARYRMLAVHGDGGIKTASTALVKDIRLRSLLYFRTGITERPKLELSFQPRYKLLRTLELQGAHLDRLPSSIQYLVCLRYLGLRGTELEYLPSSCHRLRNLMCLDIRDTKITALEDVSAFTEMRHLLLANSFCDKSVHIRNGLRFLIHLQTLSGAQHGPSTADDLEHLQFLRKLSIKKVPKPKENFKCTPPICRAISKMKFLRSLALTTDGERFDLKSLKIGKNLRKLKLGGDMGKICGHRLSMMRSITHLYLWDSKLTGDPMSTLKDLKHLLLLSLCNVYSGQELHCEKGYYLKLKKLSIISMEGLTKCEIMKGAMTKLEELVFAKCGKLEKPPKSLHDIQSIREVHLAQMQPHFCEAMRKKVGSEKVKIIEMEYHSRSSS